MPVAASRPTAEPDLVDLSREATAALDALLADAVAKVRERVVVAGKTDGRLFDREQRATHGLAWLATYVEAVRQLAAYTERMTEAGTFGEIEEPAGAYRARRVSGADRRRHSDEPGRTGAAGRSRSVGGAGRRTHQRRCRKLDRQRQHRGTARPPGRADACEPQRHGRRVRPRRHARIDPRGNAQIRRQRSRRQGAGLAPQQQLHSARYHQPHVRTRCVRADDPGGFRRHGARQGVHVRGVGGTVARLYRRRLARHALGDRRRAHSWRRHRGAEGEMAAEDRFRRNPADGGFHRAEYRLRSCFAEDARGARGRCLQGLRQQDLDHASGARRSDDAFGAHQSE